MSYSTAKSTLSKIRDQAQSANWLVRAYLRAGIRSLTARQRGGATRLLAVLLSLVFFHYFPILVLASYMSWEGFFSYDMFKSGLSGVAAFYWWTEAILIVGSAYVSGSLYFLVESKIKTGKWLPVRSVIFWLLLLVNLMMLWIMFFANWEMRDGFKKEHLMYTWLICSWIVFHVAIVINGQGKAALRSLLLGVGMLTTISFLQPGALAFPYSLSLQYFGNGGGIAVTIKITKSAENIQGRLVLNSPDHIYLYKDGVSMISVISHKDIEIIKIANLSGFGHGKANGK